MTERDDARLTLIRKLFEATGKRDWDAAELHLTDDFFVTEASSVPFAGVYRGRRALRDLYIKVMGMMDVIDLSITEITIRGDYAVTLLDMVFAGNPPVRAPLAEMFRFRGDKVCEIRPYYFDPALIVDAVNRKKRTTAATEAN